ncbi:MAG: BrnA antitoxin family protein [Gammaproteobacteria bacterium]
MKAVSRGRKDNELHQLARKPDKAIDTSDIPELTDWSGVERGRFYRPVKQQVTLRLDADILAWFRSRADKYQTGINAALREYVANHRKVG